MKDHVADGLAVTAKSSLSAAVVGATVFGYTLQEATAILGGVFILLQIVHFVWLRVSEWRAKRGE